MNNALYFVTTLFLSIYVMKALPDSSTGFLENSYLYEVPLYTDKGVLIDSGPYGLSYKYTMTEEGQKKISIFFNHESAHRISKVDQHLSYWPVMGIAGDFKQLCCLGQVDEFVTNRSIEFAAYHFLLLDTMQGEDNLLLTLTDDSEQGRIREKDTCKKLRTPSLEAMLSTAIMLGYSLNWDDLSLLEIKLKPKLLLERVSDSVIYDLSDSKLLKEHPYFKGFNIQLVPECNDNIIVIECLPRNKEQKSEGDEDSPFHRYRMNEDHSLIQAGEALIIPSGGKRVPIFCHDYADEEEITIKIKGPLSFANLLPDLLIKPVKELMTNRDSGFALDKKQFIKDVLFFTHKPVWFAVQTLCVVNKIVSHKKGAAFLSLACLANKLGLARAKDYINSIAIDWHSDGSTSVMPLSCACSVDAQYCPQREPPYRGIAQKNIENYKLNRGGLCQRFCVGEKNQTCIKGNKALSSFFDPKEVKSSDLCANKLNLERSNIYADMVTGTTPKKALDCLGRFAKEKCQELRSQGVTTGDLCDVCNSAYDPSLACDPSLSHTTMETPVPTMAATPASTMTETAMPTMAETATSTMAETIMPTMAETATSTMMETTTSTMAETTTSTMMETTTSTMVETTTPTMVEATTPTMAATPAQAIAEITVPNTAEGAPAAAGLSSTLLPAAVGGVLITCPLVCWAYDGYHGKRGWELAKSPVTRAVQACRWCKSLFVRESAAAEDSWAERMTEEDRERVFEGAPFVSKF